MSMVLEPRQPKGMLGGMSKAATINEHHNLQGLILASICIVKMNYLTLNFC